MLYQFSVNVRIVALGRWYCNMREVVRHGQVMELDQIGFYLLASEGEPCSPDDLRRVLSASVSGVVVVRAENFYEALGKYYQHPGVKGTGKERPDKKAISLEPKGEVLELPGCDMEEAFPDKGCLRFENGWPICRHVEENPMNRDHGYCHCVLQGADEPPTGCGVEWYWHNMDEGEERIVTVPAIQYCPVIPEVVVKMEAL